MKNPAGEGILGKKATALSCLGLTLWGMYLRFKTLAERELWNDEIFQISLTLGPFKPIWCRETYGDFTCFPGDYLLTYPFVQYAGFNHKWISAIPHILVTLGGFYLLYRLCQRYFTTMGGYLIAFSIFAFNGNLVFHSFELRPYAVLPVISIAVLLILTDVFGSFDRLNRTKKGLFAAVLFAVLLFHLYGVLIVGLTALWFVLQKIFDPQKRSQLWGGIKFLAGLGAVALPVWLWYALCDPCHLTRENLLASGRYVFDFIPNPTEDIVGFMKAIVGNLIRKRELYPLLLCFVVMPFVRYPERLKQIGFFLVLIILPIEILVLSDTLKAYWFVQRQFVWVMPLMAFLMGWIWDGLIEYGRGTKSIPR